MAAAREVAEQCAPEQQRLMTDEVHLSLWLGGQEIIDTALADGIRHLRDDSLEAYQRIERALDFSDPAAVAHLTRTLALQGTSIRSLRACISMS